MNDTGLRLTPTHAAEEFQGTVLGIQTDLFAWVGLALLAALAVFTGLFYGRGRDFFAAAQWAALPVLIVFAYLRFCQDKPGHHLQDVLDSLLTGGHARPPHQSPPHPLHVV
jgi:hypothetical protein